MRRGSPTKFQPARRGTAVSPGTRPTTGREAGARIRIRRPRVCVIPGRVGDPLTLYHCQPDAESAMTDSYSPVIGARTPGTVLSTRIKGTETSFTPGTRGMTNLPRSEEHTS